VNATGVQLKDKETWTDGAGASAWIAALDGFRHLAPVWRADANPVSVRPQQCREYLPRYWM